MTNKKTKKYSAYTAINYPERTWPNKTITTAPTWCSVDLRDGNQALITPMSIEKKLTFFNLLIELGFKEIEVGFPSASETEFNFLRTLIDDNLIPDDVTIQVLTQAREHLIKKTAESIEGAKNVILHLYNSTSTIQRKAVFQKSKDDIKAIAVQGVTWCKNYTKDFTGKLVFQYSPESFTATELDYALEVCEAVMDEWHPNEQLILNLPATVELSTPNVYADQIEWFSKNIKDRNRIIISLHTHNDRGTGIAATELGLMAGGQRVEGTLFGNGERTGNVDIITLALNLLTQGIDPQLSITNINKIIDISNKCTLIPVHQRQPYSGELVYTAFSGSHQDAIKKGLNYQEKHQTQVWDIPYLPIDPADVGRTYEAIIRINSQSGKGGIAYILETEYGCTLPKNMHPEFSKVIQKITDETGKEIQASEIWDIFEKEYLSTTTPFSFVSFETRPDKKNTQKCTLTCHYNNQEKILTGIGNGPIDGTKQALLTLYPEFNIRSYHEHSLEKGSKSKAIAYIELEQQGTICYGVGIDTNINIASIKAILSGLNRLSKQLEA